MSGRGWETEGWKTEADLAQISGEHWGMQRTSLLGSRRFDEHLPGNEGILWLKITHAAGRRYYLHRALRIYHTEGFDRVTVRARGTLRERAAVACAIGDDKEYLRILRDVNRDRHRRLTRRIWRARLASAFLRK